MWTLLRLVAIVVLAALTLLIAGGGDVVLGAVDAVLRPFGVVVTRDDAANAASPTVTSIGAAAGVAAALVGPADRVVGQFVTLLHELGHTVTAAALGGRPSGIVLRHDASGHATARWSSPGSFRRRSALAVVAFVGVPSAAAAAAAGAQVFLLVGPAAVLWGVAAAGAVVAVLARSAWSLLVAVMLAASAAAALRETAEPWAASAVIGLLTAVAVRAAVVEVRAGTAPIPAGDDARVVARHLHVPARLVQWAQLTAGSLLSAWTLWLLAAPLRS